MAHHAYLDARAERKAAQFFCRQTSDSIEGRCAACLQPRCSSWISLRPRWRLRKGRSPPAGKLLRSRSRRLWSSPSRGKRLTISSRRTGRPHHTSRPLVPPPRATWWTRLGPKPQTAPPGVNDAGVKKLPLESATRRIPRWRGPGDDQRRPRKDSRRHRNASRARRGDRRHALQEPHCAQGRNPRRPREDWQVRRYPRRRGGLHCAGRFSSPTTRPPSTTTPSLPVATSSASTSTGVTIAAKRLPHRAALARHARGSRKPAARDHDLDRRRLRHGRRFPLGPEGELRSSNPGPGAARRRNAECADLALRWSLRFFWRSPATALAERRLPRQRAAIGAPPRSGRTCSAGGACSGGRSPRIRLVGGPTRARRRWPRTTVRSPRDGSMRSSAAHPRRFSASGCSRCKSSSGAGRRDEVIGASRAPGREPARSPTSPTAMRGTPLCTRSATRWPPRARTIRRRAYLKRLLPLLRATPTRGVRCEGSPRSRSTPTSSRPSSKISRPCPPRASPRRRAARSRT